MAGATATSARESRASPGEGGPTRWPRRDRRASTGRTRLRAGARARMTAARALRQATRGQGFPRTASPRGRAPAARDPRPVQAVAMRGPPRPAVRTRRLAATRRTPRTSAGPSAAAWPPARPPAPARPSIGRRAPLPREWAPGGNAVPTLVPDDARPKRFSETRPTVVSVRRVPRGRSARSAAAQPAPRPRHQPARSSPRAGRRPARAPRFWCWRSPRAPARSGPTFPRVEAPRQAPRARRTAAPPR